MSFFSASMGPCLFRHGNIFALGYSFMAIRFNGAVPFQARKFYAEIKHIENSDASMGPCLFRHGNSALFNPLDTNAWASMGPCLFRHGK